MYHPDVGRFVSRDPIGYEGADENLYGYVRGAPINAADPFGMDRIVIVVEGFGAKLGISGKFVQYAEPIGQVVADKVSSANWRYFFLTNAGGAKKEAIRLATEKVTRDGGVCYHTIILLGFSMGGDAIHEIAHDLENKGISVNLVVTLDPVPRNLKPGDPDYSRSANAERWLNYYQRKSILIRGWPVTDADINKQLTETSTKLEYEVVLAGQPDPNDPNKWLREPVRGLTKLYQSANTTTLHTSVPRMAEVLIEFRESVSDIPEWRNDNSSKKK